MQLRVVTWFGIDIYGLGIREDGLVVALQSQIVHMLPSWLCTKFFEVITDYFLCCCMTAGYIGGIYISSCLV